ISLRKIALELHLSPERLCRLYKAHFGHTIREEIHALRIRKACELLKDQRLTVAEAARLAGFRDLSNFHRVFRSCKDSTPHQFRRRKNGK
ncbi:MAG: helix-turn-helix transcriptional regulator, partial [Lentisphaeria bacterium]|nr:helix-turn-helix transcriptional regulator [Lentisphaeria bacterium]